MGAASIRNLSTPADWRQWSHRFSATLLLLAVSLAGLGAVFDTGGFGFGPAGVPLLAQAGMVFAMAGLGWPGGRLRRAGGVLMIWLVGLPLLAVFPPYWLLSLVNSHRAPFYAQTDRRLVALSIDDSLDPESTPQILDVLARHGAHATFFVLSNSVKGNETLLENVLLAGHEVGNHQTRDLRGRWMSEAAFAKDIHRASETLAHHTTVRWLRPGGGAFSSSMVAAAEAEGVRLVLGSVFPFDSHLPSVNFMAGYLNQRVRPGSIIVLHDVGERGLRTAAALDRALPGLQARGFRVVTISQLFDEADAAPR